MAIFTNIFNNKKTDDQNSLDPNSGTVASGPDIERKQDLSVLSHLDSRTTQTIEHAQQEALRIRQQSIAPEQVLLGLLYDEGIFKILQDFSVDVAKLSSEIQSKEIIGSSTQQPILSDSSKQILEHSYQIAKKRGSNFVLPEDVLLALFSDSISSTAILEENGAHKDKIEEKIYQDSGTNKKSQLLTYGQDLTQIAKDGKLDPIAGRDTEIDRAIHILLRRTKNNPIIIGEAGVGKTAIVEGLAEKIVSGAVPPQLVNKKIYQIDLASLVAGASHRGEFEERLKGVINEAISSSGQVILFIDEIHTLIGTGDQEGSLDASNIIKPFLVRGQLQIIGTTTTSEYRKYFEKDKAFERRFQPILVEEPSEEVAVQMLKILKPKYENFHKVVITDEAIEAAVKLSKKYIGERFLPDKAVDLIDEASSDVKLKTGNSSEAKQVTAQDIQKVVSSWTGIPITTLTEDESKKLLQLEDRIHQRLIDQEEAVSAVSEAVRRGRIGLSSGSRPIASFVFLGPTGVGKTELAKSLAEILFGKEDAMIRLDMSEYMEKHEVAKLIGSPPGYVGYEEGGQLTEAVRTKPYSIVLFDEIEKAHPDVFNMLLQVLEDGRLTDNKGVTVSFKNTIIICTSNIGSVLIQQQLTDDAKTPEDFGKKFAQLKILIQSELMKFFKPELYNRFDGIVIFKPLRQADMRQIASLGIKKTGDLLKDQGFGLQITDGALSRLAVEGFDPVFGARPLRRLIQNSIENQIAMLIINKTFVPKDVIIVDFDITKNEFIFTKGIPQPESIPVQANQNSPIVGNDPNSNINPSTVVEGDSQLQKQPA